MLIGTGPAASLLVDASMAIAAMAQQITDAAKATEAVAEQEQQEQ
ncbi:MAG: hypothetical protein WBA10_09050 [Elainellaceae cyanobacterium]